MKKTLISLIVFISTATCLAGGLVTNTNRSIGYLRNVARGTSFSPDAVYFNPAGTAFMTDGWHLDFNVQQVFQSRTTESTFAPFAQNASYLGEATRTYTGNTFAPFVPSIHALWKKKKWAVMASFEIGGGGGSVEYKNGLASFESMFAVLPGALSAKGLPTDRYGVENMYLKATSITGTFTIGGAYQILPCLAVSLQANMNYATGSYEGNLSGITIDPVHPILNPQGEMISAYNFFNTIGLTDYANMVSDRTLDAKQKGFSISPIVAVCFHHKGWTANVKYEFMSSMYLKNDTKQDIVIGGTGMFPDGGKDSNDLPAELTVAGGYDFGKVRVSAEWHHYFDKAASNDFSNVVLGNSNEYLAGVEWDVSKKVLLSCGVQRSVFNLDLDKYSDQNFYLNSTSVGFGGGVQVCKILRLEAGCFLSFYDSRTRQETVYHSNLLGLPGKDTFKRTSVSYGLAAVFKF